MKNLVPVLAFLLFAAPATAQPSLVYDINPGPDGSDPRRLIVFDNRLIFAATDVTNGREIWTYNGMNNPGYAFNLYPGPHPNHGTDLGKGHWAILNNKLYFNGSNGSCGNELWVYNGLTLPTLVDDVNSGQYPSDISCITSFNGVLYFGAKTAAESQELHAHDPSTSTTSLHSEILAGNTTSFVYEIVPFNNKIIFSAYGQSMNTPSFYQYDPSLGGLASGLISTYGTPNSFVEINGILYFLGTHLHSYNGTTFPQIVDSIWTKSSTTFERCAAEYNGSLYFVAAETGTWQTLFHQLYKYDPTTGLTTLAATIYPNNNSDIEYLTVYNNKLYFSATTQAHGAELWVYDGTTASMVADINPGPASSSPADLTVYNGVLYFSALRPDVGTELFRYGTPSDITVAEEQFSFTLYPNPATNEISISLPSTSLHEMTITVFDITGREQLRQTANSGELKISVSHLPSGNYFCCLSDSKGTVLARQRFVKQ